MSKHETPMTRWYWRTVNKRQGLLIEEFPAVKRDGSAGKNKRHIDGVIVLGEKAERRGPLKGDRELVKGKEVIVIQSKARRLGMGLIGQVVVSRELLKDLKAKVVKSVGVCREDDQLLHKVLRRFKKCEAVVYRRGMK
jgi:hypothetical protein